MSHTLVASRQIPSEEGKSLPLEPLLKKEDLARILGLSEGTIINRRCNAPESLPPAIKIGGKELRWSPAVVRAWLGDRLEKSGQLAPSASPAPPASPPAGPQNTTQDKPHLRKRGRPTKSAQIQLRREAEQDSEQ